MKYALIIVALLAQIAMSQETVILKSDPIVLKPKKDVLTPQIRLLQPKPDSQGRIIVDRPRVAFSGIVSNTNGLEQIMVNGTPARMSGDGSFSIDINLRLGRNLIDIAAEDNLGNKGTQRVEVLYDLDPPTIEMVYPSLERTNGFLPVEEGAVTIRGRVYDDTEVSNLSLNGKDVPIGEDSTFAKRVLLVEGRNAFQVAANDIAGKTSEQQFALDLQKKNEVPEFLAGRNIAVIIGIDSYIGAWQRLRNAVSDAKAVEALLRQEFVFDRIFTLYNADASRDRIIQLFESLYDSLKADDNLFVYYSGHGVMDKRTDKGYWVPVDATTTSTSRYLSNNEIQNLLGNEPARHILLVTDACFAGDIFRGETIGIPWDNSMTYYKEVARRRSRRALTSGDVEPVLDGGRGTHSVFAYYFLKALSGVDGKFFDASRVYENLKIPVQNNTGQFPRFDAIKGIGDEGGQFIFIRK
jgi:hypothetical protein